MDISSKMQNVIEEELKEIEEKYIRSLRSGGRLCPEFHGLSQSEKEHPF